MYPFGAAIYKVITMEMLPLKEAVEKVTGRKVSLSTILRWCTRPNKYGVRLKSWMVGGRRLTTTEEVQLYIQNNTKAADK